MKTTVKYAIVFLILILMLSLSACQAAPKDDVVVNKSVGSIEKAIESEKDGFVYQVPEKWKTSFVSKTGAIKVEVDAQINIPSEKKFPVINGKAADISADQIKTMAKALFGDAPLYNQRPAALKTKPEIEKEIIDVKTGVTTNMPKDDPGFSEYIKPIVEELEAQYKSAPQSYKPVQADFGFKKAEPSGKEIRIETASGKNHARLEAYVDGAAAHPMMVYAACKEIEEPGGAVRAVKDKIPGINISTEKAKEIAESTLSKLTMFDGFSFAGAGIVPYGAIGANDTNETLQKCYVLYYTRSINDVPYTYTSNTAFAEFVSSNVDEVLEVYVDNSRVVKFTYNSPMEVLDAVNENVKLLPFDKIQDLFIKQMKIRGAWTDNPDIISRRIQIDRITLGMMRVAKNTSEYLYVPVWDFFGTSYDKYKETVKDPNNNEDNEYYNEEYASSYLTINAIDGSIIDRSAGY